MLMAAKLIGAGLATIALAGAAASVDQLNGVAVLFQQLVKGLHETGVLVDLKVLFFVLH